MTHHCTRLSYESTGYFSTIVTDYLKQSPQLLPFFAHAPTVNGIQQAIAARKQFATPRTLLVEVLQQQYANLPLQPRVQEQVQALLSENTFTVVTAHQPNIFTGPLYFVYKILHTIRLAATLSAQMPGYRFVPVYYMGSEDADLDEIGQVSIDHHRHTWATKQTGAVGRMKVDKELLKLLNAIEGQIGVLPHGQELVTLFKSCYKEGQTIQQATLELVHQLFGAYGLVVLVPDHASLKKAFEPVVTKELLEGFSHKAVSETIAQLSTHYKVQAAGREINLFYLIDDHRERIERNLEGYAVKSLGLTFSKEAILQELQQHPERFSANVILRGAFQETILPNIAFIGGGGELAYWLELKGVFEKAGIPYPALVLRNSFMLLTKDQERKMRALGLDSAALFQPAQHLMNQLVKQKSSLSLDLRNELEQAQHYYDQLAHKASLVDPTLSAHVAALATKAIKNIKQLEKKMLRAEKAKFDTEQRQLTQLKTQLFPNNGLQERTDNLSAWYGRYGAAWIAAIYEASPALDPAFTTMMLD